MGFDRHGHVFRSSAPLRLIGDRREVATGQLRAASLAERTAYDSTNRSPVSATGQSTVSSTLPIENITTSASKTRCARPHDGEPLLHSRNRSA